ncbi:MAG: hypothetical protein AAFR38_04395 [Planctomycetota bacterium]
MIQLGTVLGAIMSDIVKARRMADEQAVLTAESYRDEPLMEGMSVPRIRMPEVVVEMPVIIEEGTAGRADEQDTPENVAGKMSDSVIDAAAATETPIPRARRDELRTLLARRIEAERERAPRRVDPANRLFTARDDPGASELRAQPLAAGEVTRRASRRAMIDLERAKPLGLSDEARGAVREAIDRNAARAAIKRPGVAPSMMVNVATASMKESADPRSVARVKIVLREEGLAWESMGDGDDEGRMVLTPE